MKEASSGIGFTGLLTIVFITLKLIGYINWTWMWVLSPLWISVLGFFAIIIIIMCVLVIVDRGEIQY